MTASIDLTPWNDSIREFSATKRNLPHLQDPGGYYFTDSNTFDRWELPEFARDLVADALRFFDGEKYELLAYVVMPDHFHLILHPLPKTENGYYNLREIFHSIKSFTAKRILERVEEPPRQHRSIAKRLKTHIWQDENYDHLIRDERDYWEKMNYIINNPIEAGLVSDPYDYPWLWWIGMPAKDRGQDGRATQKL
ncbi:MAG TPA: transposase [Candidatus Kapabacteria bacterium]|nr:transposase [Candidatus Kapabacteria bacterium]